jgi:hypothetical protein
MVEVEAKLGEPTCTHDVGNLWSNNGAICWWKPIVYGCCPEIATSLPPMARAQHAALLNAIPRHCAYAIVGRLASMMRDSADRSNHQSG